MSSSSDEFHDSLERIISSSCSSTSASDSDSAPRPRRPPASSDAWLAAPAPVAERRRRLLSRMGLASSPSLHRRSFSVDFANFTTDAHPQPPPGLPRPLPPSASAGGGGDDHLRRLTIKNLDTGREFVVGEDTHEVRDVGTGRKLTMEEFEMCAGRSPIVHELMRRQRQHIVEEAGDGEETVQWRPRRRGGWLKSIKDTVVPGHQRRSSCSAAADDSWTKVRQYGKSQKELNCLFMSQEIRAHGGAIWCMKFSLDGRFLASGGEDCVIHVWEVTEKERKGEGSGNCSPFVGRIGRGSPEMVALSCIEASHWEKKRRAKIAGGRRSASVDQVMVPENVFALSEKPVYTFRGHLNDVLDLSWSKSEHLLSSSMDKTVRLWHTSCNSCLKIFTHSDYVTCIQFNPVDDRFFISGSLDEKVRIWNIPDRQIVDWDDLHEMVTAACYTPDGQGALVGSHKGNCHLYTTSDNKLDEKSQINMQNKKRKSSSKKITGFQFAQGSSSEVVITSADSRIRVVDGAKLVHKFKGFRNTTSQMTACLTANGRYVICASEDSHVYLWRYDAEHRPNRSNGIVTAAQSYENFYCQDVTVAVPWSGTSGMGGMLLGSGRIEHSLDLSHITKNNTNSSYFSDRISATWPEEKLMLSGQCRTHSNGLRSSSNRGMPLQCRSAWGMVIVTAGRGGKISAFQNFGMPAAV